MRIARLAEVAEIVRDGIAPEKIQAGTPYLGLEHIEAGGRILASEPVAQGQLASTKFRFGPDHLLYGKLRPYLAKIALPDFAGVCSTDILPVRAGPELDKRYLAYFLRQPSMVEFASSRSSGANLPRLSPKALADFEIPLPAPSEQRRIAAILDQADALRRLRRDSLARLGDLGQAIFEDRYGSLAGEVCIEDAVSDTLIGMVRNGGSFGPDFAVPYVRMDAITTDGAFLPEKVQRTDASDAEIARYALETGDILFNTRNSKELVGKTTIYRGAGPCTFNNNIMRIRMKPDWDPVFVEAFLRSKTGRQELEKRKSGTTSVWAVYWSQLKTLKIPKPSREEQASFRAFVEAIWKKADLLREDLQKMEHLFASLQHRAFRGEL